MKAIGYSKNGPITAENALEDIDVPLPELRGHDVMVQVKGISINPVDSKIRTNIGPAEGYKIIGFDGCGTITALGTEVTDHKIGDDVFYSGDMTRPGSNSAYQAVDSRIIGKKPQSLDFEEAAAIPLTAITAWELLFDCLRLREGGEDSKIIVILGGAGGVGSILIPFPHAIDDHQTKNGQWLVDNGAARLVQQAQLSPEKLAVELQQLLTDRPRLVAMAESARALAQPGAVAAVADACEELM